MKPQSCNSCKGQSIFRCLASPAVRAQEKAVQKPRHLLGAADRLANIMKAASCSGNTTLLRGPDTLPARLTWTRELCEPARQQHAAVSVTRTIHGDVLIDRKRDFEGAGKQEDISLSKSRSLKQAGQGRERE